MIEFDGVGEWNVHMYSGEVRRRPPLPNPVVGFFSVGYHSSFLRRAYDFTQGFKPDVFWLARIEAG